MIKLFRKIRQNLIMENKTGTYFKYAIGEIILVVIGILIALQINNWNEDKKDKVELNQYLSSLKENIQSDIIVLDSLVKRRAVTVAYCEKEQLNFLNKTYNFNDTRYALRAYSDFYFEPNTSAYEALKSSPYLGKINGTHLNNLVIDYYKKTEQIANNERSYNEFVENLEAKMANVIDRTIVMTHLFMTKEQVRETKLTEEEIKVHFEELHNTVGFRNIVTSGVGQERNMIVPYRDAKEIGQKIITEINKELNN